jgi:hypothetical protein
MNDILAIDLWARDKAKDIATNKGLLCC